MQVVAFVGFAGSGKNTAAQALLDDGWTGISFGSAVKDVLATIFLWPRHLLEGDTDESRAFREQVDEWWSERLCVEGFSPRVAMQQVATQAMRMNFHPEVWVAHIARRVSVLPPDARLVILDARFANEIAYARSLGAMLVRVRRGLDPAWMTTAAYANAGSTASRFRMLHHWKVHESEWAWIGAALDHVVDNDASADELQAQIRKLCSLRYSQVLQRTA